MLKGKIFISALFIGSMCSSCNDTANDTPAVVHSDAHVTVNTAADAIAALKEGNRHFVDGKLTNTNYKQQVQDTKDDQHPHTAILSCLDSRVPPEIIFDQGIGNLFIARVAGNIEDEYILGSLEYATKVKGAKLLVVLGHNHCGAVKGSIDKVALGNLTAVVNHITPAIKGDTTNKEQMIDSTGRNNVNLTIAHILSKSPVISDMVKENKLRIIGAYYDLTTGKVDFME